MKGTARTFGAITIANAVPDGIGCAAGVDLPVDAEVTLTHDDSLDHPRVEMPRGSRSPVVEESTRLALATFHPVPGTVATVTARSTIPAGRGLKSSSAVSTAVVLAVARAVGASPSSLDVGRLAAEAGRRTGVSATGALDDALAGLDTGFVVTDNRRDVVLHRAEVDPKWGVLLYIPSQRHPRSPDLVTRFGADPTSHESPGRSAMKGDWFGAMHLNTVRVERAMGYSYGDLRKRLLEHGAVASGVSGFGPALATIAPLARLSSLVRDLPPDSAEKKVVRFLTPSSTGGASP